MGYSCKKKLTNVRPRQQWFYSSGALEALETLHTISLTGGCNDMTSYKNWPLVYKYYLREFANKREI